MGNNLDESGIYSLEGFAFQIKVFAYYAFTLKENNLLEFETIEDVNRKEINEKNIDEHSDNFKILSENNTAIQVKHTKIDKTKAEKIVLNWMHLEKTNLNIKKYILFSASKYHNTEESIFIDDIKTLYNNVLISDKTNAAIITKVKNEYESYTEFEINYNKIREKFRLKNVDQIDVELENISALHFRRAANEVVFHQRLKQFLEYIQVEILKSISKRKPFQLSYKMFIKKIETISSNCTEDMYIPMYVDFKEKQKIDLKDSSIYSTREYQQLVACGLNGERIKIQLTYGLYYNEFSMNNMELNRFNDLNNILETTYENFADAKDYLKNEGKDTPYYRLDETQKRQNSYAINDQIRKGSSIYLTKSNIEDNQISWKDEDNETKVTD